MVQQTGKEKGVLRSLDWWTIIIYLALLTFGWVSVCGASYSYGDTDIFSLDTRSGMQIVWIGTSIVLGFVLLMLDDRYYDMFAFIIFGVMLVLLFGTIFNPHTIKGSRSWLVLGPLRLQPAEFAKFATALALAKLMSIYGFNIQKWKHFVGALAVVIVPMLFIVLQRETGSALVYVAFFLMFYREGMPGSILFTGVAMVIYFVVGGKILRSVTDPALLGRLGTRLLQRSQGLPADSVALSGDRIGGDAFHIVRHPVRCVLYRAVGVRADDGLSRMAFHSHAYPQLPVDRLVCTGFCDLLQSGRLCAQ